MVLDQLVQALGVVARHVAHDIDAAMGVQVAALVIEALVQLLFLRDRLKIDHRHIAATLKRPVFVQHIGNAARHARREIAARLADDDDNAAGHIFAAMVAGAFDHRDRARVADREALAGDTTEIALAADRAIEHRIAHDDRVFRHDLRGLPGRVDHELAARQALADIIIGLAFELERHAMGDPGAEALARRALQLDVDRVVGKPGMAVLLRDHARQHRAGGAVDALDRALDAHGLSRLDGGGRLCDERAVEHMLQIVVLVFSLVDRQLSSVRLVEQAREIETLGLPVLDRAIAVEHLDLADHLVDRAVAELGHQLAHFLGDEEEIVDDMLGLSDEPLAQDGVLRRDTHGTRVEMAFAHHDAAGRNQRRGGKAKFIGTQHCADDDVAPRAQAAIDLHGNARAQAVQHQRLVGLGKADFPRAARMFDRRQWRGTRAAFIARDGDVIGTPLGDAGGHRADTDLGDELHRDERFRIDVLQVVDQLGQIFDGIDVVVRRRRDQADALRGMTHLGDHRIDLVAGQLSAFAGLCTLRHLDLHHVGIDEIFRRDAKTTGRDLLDRRAHRIAIGHALEAVGFLAALTRVGPSADAVHRDGQRRVRLARDRTKGHGTRDEAPDDVGSRLDLVERHRRATIFFRRLDAEQAADRQQLLILLVEQLGKGAIFVLAVAAHRVLQQRHRLRRPRMRFATHAIGIFAADIERGAIDRRIAEGVAMTRHGFIGDLDKADALDRRRSARKEAVHEIA